MKCKKGIKDGFKVLASEAVGRIKLPSDEIGKTLGGTGLAGELGFSHLKVWSAYFESNYRGRNDMWSSERRSGLEMKFRDGQGTAVNIEKSQLSLSHPTLTLGRKETTDERPGYGLLEAR